MKVAQSFALALLVLASFLCSAAVHAASTKHGNFLAECGAHGVKNCSRDLSCVMFNKNATTTAGFFPVMLCSDEHEDHDKADDGHDHSDHGMCACAQPIVESGECNEASDCDASTSCEDNDDCDGETVCMSYNATTSSFDNKLCHGGDSCKCAKPDDLDARSCESTSDCTNTDERCAFIEIAGKNLSVCVSCHGISNLKSATVYVDGEEGNCDHSAHVSPSPSPSPEPCVAVEHLAHFQPHQLVFAQHRRASVLCDAHGNCATAGHFVAHNGRHMSMKTYCATAVPGGCSKAVRFVNSPRMRAGLRVPSRSKDLTFTALSARYNSKVEEWALAAVLRFGM